MNVLSTVDSPVECWAAAVSMTDPHLSVQGASAQISTEFVSLGRKALTSSMLDGPAESYRWSHSLHLMFTRHLTT